MYLVLYLYQTDGLSPGLVWSVVWEIGAGTDGCRGGVGCRAARGVFWGGGEGMPQRMLAHARYGHLDVNEDDGFM
jgi:hypothetical protein